MAKKQELFTFARMTPAEYQDDLQQLRIPGLDELEECRALDRLESKRPRITSCSDCD